MPTRKGRKKQIPLQVKKDVYHRAMAIIGHCECPFETHDHGFNECHRKPRYYEFRHRGIHVMTPDNLMLVCSDCRRQIRLEH